VRRDSRPKRLFAEVEASLKRLHIDTIDLVQLHQPDEDTRIEDSLHALQRMREQGKLRAIGICNVSPSQLQRAQYAMAPQPLDALQCEYSLLERWPEASLVGQCRERGTSLLAYGPLARGLLSSSPKRLAERPLAARACIRAWRDRVLAPTAQQLGLTPGQLALAFLLAQPGVSSVIAGASTVEQLRENHVALRAVLSQSQQARLAQSSSQLSRTLGVLAKLRRLPPLAKLEAWFDQ
jgi:aryl-alcohol dehydrogenase-like predicted oxidoreductase